jgi:uncharacterized protein
MRETILEKLAQIEKDKQVKILYACESGSRAWGFASPDSDYDVRFIYMHPADYYLSIDEAGDTIELPINDVLDISGWDIRKALKLLRKSNPPLTEWLQSPIVYLKHDDFYTELREFSSKYFIPRSGYNHYLSMTVNTFEGDLSAETVKLKKYFYALRPILACLWIVEKGTLPPMEFDKLRVMANDVVVQKAIDNLLVQKTNADEKFSMQPISVLHNYIAQSIEYCRQNEQRVQAKRNESDELNKLFRKYLNAGG